MKRDHFVYWLFAADGDCLYVGITIRPEGRWKDHRRRFGAEVANKRMAGPYTKQVARQIEREQIEQLRPKYDGHWGKRRLREIARQERATWPVYSVTEAARLFGMPEETLREHMHPYEFVRIPDDDNGAAA